MERRRFAKKLRSSFQGAMVKESHEYCLLSAFLPAGNIIPNIYSKIIFDKLDFIGQN